MRFSLAALGSPAAAASRLCCSSTPSSLTRLIVLSRQRANDVLSQQRASAHSILLSSPSTLKKNSVRAMATSQNNPGGGEKLDKNTPDEKWKDILNAEQVRSD